MLASCPQCQIDVLADPPGACPRCGFVLPVAAEACSAKGAADELGADALCDDPASSRLVITGVTPAIEPLPEPNLAWALGTMLLTYVGTIVLTFFIFFAIGVFAPAAARDFDLIVSLGSIAVSFSMLLMGWTGLQPRPRRSMGMRPPRALHLAIAVLLALALQVVWTGAENALLGTEYASSRISDVAWNDIDDHWYVYYAIAKQPWLAALIIGCVLPAVSEEIFFRGFIGRGLVARQGPIFGVLITSVLFGLVHIEPVHIAFACCMGVLLHVMFLCSQSIWPPMLMHFVANALALVMMKLQLQERLPASFFSDMGEPPLLLSALSLIAILLCLLWRTRRTWQTAQGEKLARGFISVAPPVAQPTAVLHEHRAGRFIWPVLALSVVAFVASSCNFAIRQRGPFAAQPYLVQADAAYAQEDNERALKLYSRAVELAPDDAFAWHGRSISNLVLNHPEEALADADRALALAPEMGHARASRAAALNALGRSADALADARLAVKQLPDDAWACAVLVEATLEQSQYEEAIAEAQRGRTLDPSLAYFPSVLAYIFCYCPQLEYRNKDRAMVLAEKACELADYQDAAHLTVLAGTWLAEGHPDQASNYLDMAAALDAGMTSSHAELCAKNLREFGPALLELRASWQKHALVDDVVLYRALRKCVVIVPLDHRGATRNLTLDVEAFAGWQHQVMTADEYELHVRRFADQLRGQTLLSPDQCRIAALHLALDVSDLLKIDEAQIAETLALTQAEAAEVKVALQAAGEARQ